MIKRVPVPLSGVMLSLAALGNLLQSYSQAARYFCGLLSLLLFTLIVLKIILYPSMIKQDFSNPIMASVAATFPMGLMLLSVYAKPFIGIGAQVIWFTAVIMHSLLIIYFTYQFVLKFEIKKVFASYFIVYVGIAAAGITAPAYNMQYIGSIAFWFGFISFIILFPVIGHRYFKHRDILEPAQPIFCIFAAPASLCLAAYIQSITNKSIMFIGFMAILGFMLYIIALFKGAAFLKLKFYPSYAAFTFPFVISGIAMKQTSLYLNSIGRGISILNYIVIIQTVIAVILVFYTLMKFIKFILTD